MHDICRKIDATGDHYVKWSKLYSGRQIPKFLSYTQFVFNFYLYSYSSLCLYIITAERGPWDGEEISRSGGKMKGNKRWREINGLQMTGEKST